MEPDSADVSTVPVCVFGTDCEEFIHQPGTDAEGKEERRRAGNFAVGAGGLHSVSNYRGACNRGTGTDRIHKRLVKGVTAGGAGLLCQTLLARGESKVACCKVSYDSCTDGTADVAPEKGTEKISGRERSCRMMGRTEKCEKLYEAITELPDELISEAEEYSTEKEKTVKKNGYLKWVFAAAACLVLFCSGVVSGILLTESRQQGGLTQTKTDGEREGFQFLVNSMASNNRGSTQTKPAEDLFSNYMNVTIDNYTEIASLYKLYGITSGNRIEKIVYCAGNDASQMVTVTDEEALWVFYEQTLGLHRYSEGDFFDNVISKMSKEEIADFHGDCRVLEIATTNGLVFTYSFYPKSGWLFCGSTMSFYVLGDEFLQWFQNYCEE